MNSLGGLAHVLETGSNEVIVDTAIAVQARHCIQRMLDFSKGMNLSAPPASVPGIGPA